MVRNLETPNAAHCTRALGGSSPRVGTKVERQDGRALDTTTPASPLREFRRADVDGGDLSGVCLGSYTLGQKLGEGGMGSLFYAYHRQLGKACVVKFIHAAMASNEQAIGRFLQEIRAVGQLNHPKIVCSLDAGCADGVHYYVTELLEGRDLQRFVQDEGAIDLTTSCSIIQQVLDGLEHAHDHGLIHRDIKPSNLFFTNDGYVKLLDFGLVRNTRQSNGGLTTSDQFLGTLDYLAPEQAEDPTCATPTSDIYSLGLTWIYLLSGQKPFPDDQYSTSVSKLRGQLIDDPSWFTDNADKLPASVRELLSAMIRKDPQQRLQNCREVSARLASHADAWRTLATQQDQVRQSNRRTKSLIGTTTISGLLVAALAFVLVLPQLMQRRDTNRLDSKSTSADQATPSIAASSRATTTAEATPSDVVIPHQMEPSSDLAAASKANLSSESNSMSLTRQAAISEPAPSVSSVDSSIESSRTLPSTVPTANAKVRKRTHPTVQGMGSNQSVSQRFSKE